MKVMKIIKMVYFFFFLINIALNAQDIFISIEKGDIEVVRYLLERDSTNVNIINKDGNTPLHIAILKGHLEIFKYLLIHNPDLEIKNKRGFTPLLCASWMFHRDRTFDYKGIIESLLERGAKANVAGNDRYNPLHWINHPSENSMPDILELNKLFINMGVDLNEQNIYGSTPLSYAVHIHPDVAKILIENGAEVNIKDNQGRTPLFRISGFNHPNSVDTVKLLIENGAIIDTQNDKGQTAFERAIENGRKDIADMLISHQNKNKTQDFPVLKGPYLGQKPPGETPEIFAPGIISTGMSESCPAFTPDGKEFYYKIGGAPHDVILSMVQTDNRWSKPEVVTFSGKYNAEFSMSPDGNRIVFSSNRPVNGKGEPREHYFCWIVERNHSGWVEPTYMPSVINSGKFAGYPSLSKVGNLYFYAERVGGIGVDDIYWSKVENGKFTEPVNLGSMINSEFVDADPFIDPEENYLLFCSVGRLEGFGGADLYVSFRKRDNSWTKAINMGEKINSVAWEICPSISPDGRYLFFSSSRKIHRSYSEKPIYYEEKIKIMNSPGNGNSDIYWVDAKIIEELKPKELK